MTQLLTSSSTFPSARATQVRPANTVTRIEAHLAHGPALGFPSANTSTVREWVPGVTGPYGWYDSHAAQALVDERQEDIERLVHRIRTGIHFTGFLGIVGYLTWLTTAIVMPVLS